jgi:hypothetical protein
MSEVKNAKEKYHILGAVSLICAIFIIGVALGLAISLMSK